MKGFRAVCVIVVAVVSAITAPAAFGTAGTMVVSTDTTLTEDHQGQIVVNGSGVTLDCAGHRVTGPDARLRRHRRARDGRHRARVRGQQVRSRNARALATRT